MLETLQRLMASEGDAEESKPLHYADTQLINQFYVTLSSSYERIMQRLSGQRPASLTEVKTLLDATPRSWRKAYHVEQLLVPFLSDSELEMELERRMVDGKGMLSMTVYGTYQKALGRLEAEPDATVRRTSKEALLSRLINDLQWKYQVAEGRKELGRIMTSRTAWFFITVFVIFLLYLLFATGWLLSGVDGSNPIDNAVNDRVIGQPVMFYFFTVGLAILAGCLGACFSMLTGLKGRLERGSFDDLKIMCTRANIGTRVLIGICAGLIVYYFIRAGLLTGPLVPDLVVKAPPYDLFTALALLVVWCFLGGFSEKLVPTLLSKTEKQAGVVGEVPPPPPPAGTGATAMVSGDGAVTTQTPDAALVADAALTEVGDTAPAETGEGSFGITPEASVNASGVAPADPEGGEDAPETPGAARTSETDEPG